MKNKSVFAKGKHIHLVGIKGVAMTAFAVWAREKGMNVTGSDVADTFPTDATLARFGIIPQIGFQSQFSTKPNVVVYTGAHGGSTNPEVIRARQRSIPTYPHGQALGLIMEGYWGISVCGSHGKTTTSAMIAFCLMHAGLNPSYLIGCAEITGLAGPGHFGSGDYFVAEADEYVTDPVTDPTPRFLWQHPQALVITNIDYDHPDAFADITAVEDAFVAFTEKRKSSGFVVACSDNLSVQKILPRIAKPIVTYGFTNADFEARNLNSSQGVQNFAVFHHGNKLGSCTLSISGHHSVLNATATIVCLVTLGVPFEKITHALGEFSGTKRRFELLGEKNGVDFYDDYAHHPTEIAATLEAARQRFGNRRIIAVFQPHTYSRTKALLAEFSTSFTDADIVVITEIYPSAREKPRSDITGEVLSQHIAQHHKGVVFQPDKARVVQYLQATTKPKDVVITVGAGDIYQWVDELIAKKVYAGDNSVVQ